MKRVLTGTVWGIALLVMWLCQGTVLRVGLAAMMIEAVREMLQAFKKHGDRVCWWPAMAFALLAMPAYACLGTIEVPIALLVGCCILGMVAVVLRGEADFHALVSTLFPMLYPGLLFLAVFALQDLPDRSAQMCVALTFALPCLCDVAAYEVGSRWGRHKLCPQLSPKKSVEGAVAGLLASMIGAVLLNWMMPYLLGNAEMASELPAWWSMLILGALAGVAGQCGDLVASLVKRYCGIKDYANFLPGHGGIMDRFDSNLLCGSMIYVCFLFMQAIGAVSVL